MLYSLSLCISLLLTNSEANYERRSIVMLAMLVLSMLIDTVLLYIPKIRLFSRINSFVCRTDNCFWLSYFFGLSLWQWDASPIHPFSFVFEAITLLIFVELMEGDLLRATQELHPFFSKHSVYLTGLMRWATRSSILTCSSGCDILLKSVGMVLILFVAVWFIIIYKSNEFLFEGKNIKAQKRYEKVLTIIYRQ